MGGFSPVLWASLRGRHRAGWGPPHSSSSSQDILLAKGCWRSWSMDGVTSANVPQVVSESSSVRSSEKASGWVVACSNGGGAEGERRQPQAWAL